MSSSTPALLAVRSAEGLEHESHSAPFNDLIAPRIGTERLMASQSAASFSESEIAAFKRVTWQEDSSQVFDSDEETRKLREQNDGEAMVRFANLSLEPLRGEIYALCKDQHGVRYLQKTLEDRNPEQVRMIWLETNQHVVELMTDPFGNYLCQKLLEYCNNEERTVLIENASHDLVRIALNQYGTRVLLKMIEFISTPGQVQTIINALRYRVIELIQDLNGTHVIFKYLNKFSSTDAQFIFDAVGTHCVDVGAHRYGCSVLQRCIDHASGDQKAWLIRQISNNAYVLVQDPVGNYVVQYILDLNEPIFSPSYLCRSSKDVSANYLNRNLALMSLRSAFDALKNLLRTCLLRKCFDPASSIIFFMIPSPTTSFRLPSIMLILQ
jgi:hypothetical protein